MRENGEFVVVEKFDLQETCARQRSRSASCASIHSADVVLAHVGADRLQPRAPLDRPHRQRTRGSPRPGRRRRTGLTDSAHSPSSGVRAGVLGQDQHAVALVHERRLLGDEVHAVEDRVHEAARRTACRRRREPMKLSSIVSSIGVQPSVLEAVVHAARLRAGSRRDTRRTRECPAATGRAARACRRGRASPGWPRGRARRRGSRGRCSSRDRSGRRARSSFSGRRSTSSRSDCAAPARSRRARRTRPGRPRSDAPAERATLVESIRPSPKSASALGDVDRATRMKFSAPAAACGSRPRRWRARPRGSRRRIRSGSTCQ